MKDSEIASWAVMGLLAPATAFLVWQAVSYHPKDSFWLPPQKVDGGLKRGKLFQKE
jgi:hypothetical protein